MSFTTPNSSLSNTTTTLPLQILANLTSALNATLNASTHWDGSSTDATAPQRDTITNITAALNATLDATLSSGNDTTTEVDAIDPDTLALQTFRDVERGHVNA
ncbi:hypothetical protein HK104_008108, partial [Borealophlyctis nickersoniae]